jgi:hypothetical protein
LRPLVRETNQSRYPDVSRSRELLGLRSSFVRLLDQSVMLPALRLTTVAVMAPARSEAMKAAVSATSARVGSRLSSVPCSSFAGTGRG